METRCGESSVCLPETQGTQTGVSCRDDCELESCDPSTHTHTHLCKCDLPKPHERTGRILILTAACEELDACLHMCRHA